MARGDRRHSGARPGVMLRRTSTALVVGVLAASVAAFGLDLGPRWLGWDYPSPVEDPAAVAPPPGLELPELEDPPEVAPVLEGGAADPVQVRRAVRKLLRDQDLGRHVVLAVDELDGTAVHRFGEGRFVPASTTKLLTAAAVLEVLGGDHRFRTTVVANRTARRIVLVGGGDPLLARSQPPDGTYPARADITTLAKATARSLAEQNRDTVRVGYDASLFSGPAVNPTWEPSYLPDDVVSPISALWVDEGRRTPGLAVRDEDPALAAAQAFAKALRRQGVTVRGALRPRTAPAEDSREIAAVRGAPLAQVVQWALEVSDNEASEVLLRHVALGTGREGSFAGGTAAVADVLGGLGIDMTGDRLADGSGLSRRNRLSADTLLGVLRVAASPDHPGLRPVVAALPVAGFTGSLSDRFDTGDPEGLGRVRAKTGTLSGVHGLAGVVTGQEGTVLLFVAVADRVRLSDTLDARATLDEVAAALAACRCAA